MAVTELLLQAIVHLLHLKQGWQRKTCAVNPDWGILETAESRVGVVRTTS